MKSTGCALKLGSFSYVSGQARVLIANGACVDLPMSPDTVSPVNL